VLRIIDRNGHGLMREIRTGRSRAHLEVCTVAYPVGGLSLSLCLRPG
jgi:hypothetical protein